MSVNVLMLGGAAVAGCAAAAAVVSAAVLGLVWLLARRDNAPEAQASVEK